MTELLVRTFVKDYKNTGDTRVRTAYGTMAGMVGIFCNILLFGAKLSVGLLLHSISVMADAFNNLSDAASSIISLIGVRMAEKPADEDHPFGHGRIEYIAAFIVAFIVIQVGFSLFKTSLGKIRNPEELNFQVVSLVILLLSVGVKLWMGMFNRKLGKRINSSVMMATAADSLGDVAATSAAILAIVIYAVFGINVDGIAGIVVSVFVMLAGLGIAKDTLAPLIGAPVDPKVYEEISNFVAGFDGILGTHDLIVHNYGPSRSMASIHAEVPNDVDVQVSHEIVDEIEREALRSLGLFLVIHMDPVEVHNEKVAALKDMVTVVLQNIDSRLEFHDFRVVEGEKRINLIFDVVSPREYKGGVQENLRDKICEEVRKQDPRCVCVVTVERSFKAED